MDTRPDAAVARAELSDADADAEAGRDRTDAEARQDRTAAEAAFDPQRPPVRFWYMGHPVPDLSRIPREHWLSVLADSHPNTYQGACGGLDGDEIHVGLATAGEALLLRGERAAQRRADAAARVSEETIAWPRGIPTGPPPRLARQAPPAGSAPPARPALPFNRPRQVNFRLSAFEYEDLERTAQLLSLPPTSAARLLAVRGMQQVLREADRPDRLDRPERPTRGHHED